MTRVNILGADGGIGKDSRTSCFLIDDDILIDAGTGLGDLTPDAMAKIDHIFLSHIHMDHIACLPLLIDTVASRRQSPVTVYVPGEDYTNLSRHIFNNVIWPDFTRIPSPENPALQIVPLSDSPYDFNGRHIGALPVNHHGEAVGYWVDEGNGALVFTGDTGPCEEFWRAVNDLPDIRYLIVECSFPSSLEELALITGHLTPSLLEKELQHLKGKPDIFATHMKPMGKAEILEEISALSSPHDIGILEIGQTIDI